MSGMTKILHNTNNAQYSAHHGIHTQSDLNTDVQQDGPPTIPNRTHNGNTSLYQCADCQRRYSRPEHLARHIQTHTLGKRFFCDICTKAFARADLLKRHAANHNTDSEGTKKRKRIGSSPAAGRVTHACRACATARVKCEESKPCSRCRHRNLNCEYGSSEAGSAAAMHLLHLSTNGRTDDSNVTFAAGQNKRPSISTQSPMENSADQVAEAHETGQLPTPETINHCNSEGFTGVYDGETTVNVGNLPFSDFLRDVMTLEPFDASRFEDPQGQGLAVLNFCDDSNLELNDIDFGLLDYYNGDSFMERHMHHTSDGPFGDPINPSDMSEMRQKLAKMWTDSPWSWHPEKTDHASCEQANLPVPSGDMSNSQFQENWLRIDRVTQDRLEQSSRDKVLAIVLRTCSQTAVVTRVASSFPSVDLMDYFVNLFLASHLSQASTWIHHESLTLNTQWPEWLGALIAAGAVLTPIPTLRKFGFALQEAMRLAIPSRFEENNSTTRDLGLVQGFIMQLDTGQWSGNRRKMEIAESHSQAPITMLRAAGKFRRSSYPLSTVDINDEGEVLKEKWRRWVKQESWKRLVFHCFIRDAQASMTTLVNPVMSYAELTLALPEPRDLWSAKTASEWKMLYLGKVSMNRGKVPSLGDLLRDTSTLSTSELLIDLRFSVSIYLHGLWGMVWEYRQLNAIHHTTSANTVYQSNPNLVLASRHQELCRTIHQFQLNTSDWIDTILTSYETLILNLLLMNLHVSLDDLQLFAGKEGEDSARQIYPSLQQWADSQEARQALWHAGQVLRAAKFFPSNRLKDFYAVAVHHASLALWTYGVVTKAMRCTQPQALTTSSYEPVYLDSQGPEPLEMQRFISVGKGTPTIMGVSNGIEASLDDPRRCMEIAHEILVSNFRDEENCLPPIVENLCGLIKQLGNAAWAVGLG